MRQKYHELSANQFCYVSTDYPHETWHHHIQKRRKTCLVVFAVIQGIRDTLKSECSAKNFKERGRGGFYFQGTFLKISVRLFCLPPGVGLEIMKVMSYFLPFILFSYVKYSSPWAISHIVSCVRKFRVHTSSRILMPLLFMLAKHTRNFAIFVGSYYFD